MKATKRASRVSPQGTIVRAALPSSVTASGVAAQNTPTWMERPRWGNAPKCLFKAKPADACASQRAILNDEPTVVEANKVGIITDSELRMYISNLAKYTKVFFEYLQVYFKYLQSTYEYLQSISQILVKYDDIDSESRISANVYDIQSKAVMSDAQPRSLVATQPRSPAASQPHSPAAPLPRCLAAPLPRCPAASLPRCLAALLPQTNIVAWFPTHVGGGWENQKHEKDLQICDMEHHKHRFMKTCL